MLADRSRTCLSLGVCAALLLAASGLRASDESTKKTEEPKAQQPTGPDPRVSIEPRLKTKPAESEANAEEERRSNIRIDTTLVLVPVSVTDPMNRFVTGLEKEHFKVFEDKVEQEIRQFSSEDAPLSVGIVFDTSGSMGSKLQKSRQAVAQFLKTANPEDEFFLIQFNDRPELTVPFTRNTEDI